MGKSRYEGPLVLLINYSHFVFLSPIEVRKAPHSNSYIVASSSFRKIGTFVLIILGAVLTSQYIGWSIKNSESQRNSPLLYFDLSMLLVQLISGFVVPFQLWNKRVKIVELCNLLKCVPETPPCLHISFTFSEAFSKFSFLSVCTFSCSYAWHLSITALPLMCHADNEAFFLTKYFCSTFWSLCIVCQIIPYCTQSYLLFSVTHCTYSIVQSFKTQLEACKFPDFCKTGDENNKPEYITELELRLNVSQILFSYSVIKNICNVASDAFGSALFLNLVLCVIALARYLDGVLFSSSYLEIGMFCYQTVMSLLIYFEAAEIVVNLSSCQNWLAANRIPGDYLGVINTELRNKDVGLKMCNKFTITYSTLWNALASLVTYFLVSLQSEYATTI